MTPDVVVDVGNTRIKWGRCLPTVAEGDWVSLQRDALNVWDEQAKKWQIPTGSWWAIGGVDPARVEMTARWVKSFGGSSVVFQKPSQLPIRLAVDEPDSVGIDRVFGAIAAKSMVPSRTPAITVDVGTAVTVNLVDAKGVFQGGGILPGPRLMTLALHQHTAKLPIVELTEIAADEYPGKNTAAAIRLGLDAALTGGVNQLVSFFAARCEQRPWLFITGGGHHLLAGYQTPCVAEVRVVPTLNLEGIRIAAEALP